MENITQERVNLLRSLMRAKSLDVCIIRSTDIYLSEYIPLDENHRAFLSGFTGSAGDMIVTTDKAWLFVDGRYHTQAELELSDTTIEVIKVPFGYVVEESLQKHLYDLVDNENHTSFNMAYNSRHISVNHFQLLKKAFRKVDVKLFDIQHRLMKSLGFPRRQLKKIKLESVPISIAGKTPKEKIEMILHWMQKQKIQFFLITQLDDLAYLTNLRSYETPYNSTFKGIAIICEPVSYFFIDTQTVPSWVEEQLSPIFNCYSGKEYSNVISELFKKQTMSHVKIGFDAYQTPFFRIKEIKKKATCPIRLIRLNSPLTSIKNIKLPEEIKAMVQSFNQADKVIQSAIEWVNRELNSNKTLSEKDFSNQVKKLFYDNGAKGLSFEVIAASGENSTIVHYTNPDPNKILKINDLMLLDTGAYFEGGYATDLTRTFILGGYKAQATDKQKKIYSIVLKSAIRLLKACFPKGTKGMHLDTIVRSTLWDYGYFFNHGTGHGVGINVHETPPRINGQSFDLIQENMVFSVEPGIYLEGFGGVRIENLVTVKQDLNHKGWLKIVPLTFAFLDENLIDRSYLDEPEQQWLTQYLNKNLSFY